MLCKSCGLARCIKAEAQKAAPGLCVLALRTQLVHGSHHVILLMCKPPGQSSSPNPLHIAMLASVYSNVQQHLEAFCPKKKCIALTTRKVLLLTSCSASCSLPESICCAETSGPSAKVPKLHRTGCECSVTVAW